ncbi:MAG: hypothetical protein ACRCY9_16265 [Phycicoccus sp.]
MDAVIETARELVRRLQDKVDELSAALNRVLGWIPPGMGWVADRIHDGWNQLIEKLAEFWAWVDEHLNNPGSPSVLSQTAQDWNTSVGGPVSSQAGIIDAGQLLSDDRWSGTAAEAYKQAITPQKTAMDKVKTSMVDGVFQALDKMQTGIIVFWVAFAVGVAACIGGLIGAIASTASILGAPAGPFIAAAAVVALIAALAGGALKLKSDIDSAEGILVGKLNDLGAYPGGSWPRAVGL